MVPGFVVKNSGNDDELHHWQWDRRELISHHWAVLHQSHRRTLKGLTCILGPSPLLCPKYTCQLNLLVTVVLLVAKTRNPFKLA